MIMCKVMSCNEYIKNCQDDLIL